MAGSAGSSRASCAIAAFDRALDEHTLAVDLDEDNCPGLATLVAAVEEWRGSSHAGEASLELDGEIRILRTEI